MTLPVKDCSRSQTPQRAFISSRCRTIQATTGGLLHLDVLARRGSLCADADVDGAGEWVREEGVWIVVRVVAAAHESRDIRT